MRPNFAANDNASAGETPPTGETSCDSKMLIALLNTRSALEALLPHAVSAPLKDKSYAIGAIQLADVVIERMGVTHVR